MSLTDISGIPEGLVLSEEKDGLHIKSEGQDLHCDFRKLLPRLRQSNLQQELLVKAAKIKNKGRILKAVDATAGLGEDSFLLAAAGFSVKLYERNPVIAALLKDAVKRASEEPDLAEIAGRMEVLEADSIIALKDIPEQPDVIFLDPMFPPKDKNSLTKKKFQLLHCLEEPCMDEEELLQSAVLAGPHKIVIKRPLRSAYLGNRRPDYSLKGKAIRYDVIVLVQKENEIHHTQK